MCESCWSQEDDYQEEKKKIKVILPDTKGMQYRSHGNLGYWNDVEEGQTSFEVGYGTLEFRKKPKIVATITYSTNTADFYDHKSLLRAIEINVQNGHEFKLDVKFN